jgi:hypothetical protein
VILLQIVVVESVLLAGVATEKPDASAPLIACSTASAGPWVTVRDHRRALAFIESIENAHLEFAEGRPFDCGLKVIARCGPDLDGDGKGELAVRVEWAERYGDLTGERAPPAKVVLCHDPTFQGASAPYSSVFLVVSRDAPSPMGKVLLLEDETGAGREGPTSISFTRWHGQPAIALGISLTHETSEGGTTESRERTLVVRKGRLEVVRDIQLPPRSTP